MQVAETQKFKKKEKHVHKIHGVEPIPRTVTLHTAKEKVKFIKGIESMARSSREYKDYIAYLKKYIDMTCCSFFEGITSKNTKGVKIEIHHEPFTLFDLTSIVVDKWTDLGKPLNQLLIAEEVMKLHYRGLIGLIPLSLTVHQLVHDNKIFIPLQHVFGDVTKFIEEYESHINDDYLSMMKLKLDLSKKLQDNSILDTSYMYIEVDGFRLPSVIETE